MQFTQTKFVIVKAAQIAVRYDAKKEYNAFFQRRRLLSASRYWRKSLTSEIHMLSINAKIN